MHDNQTYTLINKIETLEKQYALLSSYNSDDAASQKNLLLLRKKCLTTLHYYYDVALVLAKDVEAE